MTIERRGHAASFRNRCVRVAPLLLGLCLVSSGAVATEPDQSRDDDEALAAADFHHTDPGLRTLIESVLAANPSAGAARSRSHSGHERVAQARSLPDPQVSYRLFASTPETRVGPQEHMLEFSQGIPWGGKRALQGRRAESMARAAAWDAENVERMLVADVKRAYFDAVYLREALTVNREEQELLRRFESIALKRYATGEGIQQSVVKVQTEISRLFERETALNERLLAISRRITELTGGSVVRVEVDTALSLPDVELDGDALEREAIERHPRVRAAERRIEADRLWSERQSLETRPDFRVGFGYTLVDRRSDPAGVLNPPQDNGKDVFGLTVGVNLPLYRKRIRAGVAEARESQRSSEQVREAVRNRLRYEVQESVLRAQSLYERGLLYRDVIVPQAEESLASAEAAYSTNRQRFLDLLDAERVLFEARLAYHRIVSDYWIALTDLELAIGSRFPAEPRIAVAEGEEGVRHDG